MKKKLNILCTICARGGSKEVKNKNIRSLAGKPLISYTIKQALKWGKADDVIVSTDSEAIKSVAEKYGAKVPFKRPAKLAGDNASKLLSIRHALSEAERIFDKKYDIVVDLDATSPLRKIKDLDNCLKIFLKKRPKNLFSVVKAHRNPYFNMVEEKKNGFVKLSKSLSKPVVRRQSAPAVYSMNASIYFFTGDFLLKTKNLMPFTDKTAVYVMDDISAYDIDREIDFKFIEILIKEGIWQSEVY
jgi:CMP-N,N'-diacetyllegionaminic acid synthase